MFCAFISRLCTDNKCTAVLQFNVRGYKNILFQAGMDKWVEKQIQKYNFNAVKKGYVLIC